MTFETYLLILPVISPPVASCSIPQHEHASCKARRLEQLAWSHVWKRWPKTMTPNRGDLKGCTMLHHQSPQNMVLNDWSWLISSQYTHKSTNPYFSKVGLNHSTLSPPVSNNSQPPKLPEATQGAVFRALGQHVIGVQPHAAGMRMAWLANLITCNDFIMILSALLK